ncbi:MAG: DUF2029 domain-containing protein, partial [Rickettsiales bacterium]|nr:DUF2029 domain-containing protein [Rickettsiales bacterium]
HGLHHRFSRWLVALFAALCLICLYAQTIIMRPLQMQLSTPEYTAVYGKESRQVWFHWHEMFHYYLGAKYFPENQYTGLYEATLLADSELPSPRFAPKAIHYLADPMKNISAPEALKRAREIHRPRFTDERWNSFKADLQALESIASPGEMEGVMNDYGYNPPPTWAVFGHTLARLIPLDEAHAWLGNLRPYWYQAHWLPLIDVAMLSTALFLLMRAFGTLALAGFLCLYCVSIIAYYNWTSGSFLRWTWLSELIVGACFLKRGRLFTGGVFLGLSTVDRIFPGAFLLGGALPMLLKREWKQAMRYTAGAGVAITIMVGASLLIFGPESWANFYHKIAIHKDTVFMQSMGYKRIAMFAPDITNAHLFTPEAFQLWNLKMQSHWELARWYHYPFMAALLALCVFAALRISIHESALLFGGVLFFLTQITTSYYYIYMPLILAVVLASRPTRGRDAILFSVFAFQLFTWLAMMISYDKVVIDYWHNIGLCFFFTFWALVRSMETYLTLTTKRPTPA